MDLHEVEKSGKKVEKLQYATGWMNMRFMRGLFIPEKKEHIMRKPANRCKYRVFRGQKFEVLQN